MSPETDLPAGSVETRRRILLLVERYPGLHLREVQRRIGTSPMLAEYHLNALEKMGLIASSEEGGYRNFFPARNLPIHLDATDRKWLSLLRRPAVLGMVLSLLESPARPIDLARAVGMPASTATYQIKAMRQAGLAVQGDEASPTRVRLADSHRVLELLRTYHPMPDAITRFAQMWANAIQAVQQPPPPEPAPAAPAMPLPPDVAAAPASVQQVYQALAGGPLTSKDLCLETGLARRTVYTALNELRSLGRLEEKGNLGDMRQTRFWLKP